MQFGNWKLATTVCLAGVMLAISAPAQTDAKTQKDIQLTRQMIQTERQTIIREAMDLTSEESDAFWPVYRDWRAKVAGVGDRQVKLITDFADKYETLSDEDAKAMMNEWLKIKEQRLKLTKQYVKKFRKVLPEKKVMRFFQLENKMDAVINFQLAGSIPLAK